MVLDEREGLVELVFLDEAINEAIGEMFLITGSLQNRVKLYDANLVHHCPRTRQHIAIHPTTITGHLQNGRLAQRSELSRLAVNASLANDSTLSLAIGGSGSIVVFVLVQDVGEGFDFMPSLKASWEVAGKSIG